jgi:hypothetical protein
MCSRGWDWFDFAPSPSPTMYLAARPCSRVSTEITHASPNGPWRGVDKSRDKVPKAGRELDQRPLLWHDIG